MIMLSESIMRESIIAGRMLLSLRGKWSFRVCTLLKSPIFECTEETVSVGWSSQVITQRINERTFAELKFMKKTQFSLKITKYNIRQIAEEQYIFSG